METGTHTYLRAADLKGRGPLIICWDEDLNELTADLPDNPGGALFWHAPTTEKLGAKLAADLG